MGFDVRIPPSVDAMAFKSVLEGWCFCEEGYVDSWMRKEARNVNEERFLDSMKGLG
ncbi:hypothetical protein HMI56_005958 [Coelomomyces lativittatus]|nr:hypothetical protein HMI56_005958 [Coelomomyces lativittatus]